MCVLRICSSMASVQGMVPAIYAVRTSRSLFYSANSASSIASLVSVSAPRENGRRGLVSRRFGGISETRVCRAMVQQAVQGAPATYAKEMERLSAKESLLLAVSSYFDSNFYSQSQAFIVLRSDICLFFFDMISHICLILKCN